MRTTTIEKLSDLQKTPSHVRNICILAHVDHGKTTLADALVASNGIISQKMAGKLRYLDSREDEQERGITMKSSAISLHYQQGIEEYLINLIDSPGHVDFSSEVSTAVRICDGAVVIVDAVEGVCPQTHAVLRQAWLENIKPILVLNKVDRLIMELKMEPMEAYIHLQQILEQVNVVTSELFTADVMSMQTTDTNVETGTGQQQTYDWTEDADVFEHRNIYFAPDQGNVVFAAALDGWGFTIHQFADIYAKKLGMNKTGLQKTLWGDFYLNSKTKRILKGAQSKGKKPLFVQFVLESIWSVYDAVMVQRDTEMTEKIIKSLNLKISPRDLCHSDARIQLQAIMNQWLPVSKAVLAKVVDKLPSPVEMSEEKVEKLMCNQTRRFDSLPLETQNLKQAFMDCKATAEAPVIVFVSKMFPVERSVLPKNKPRSLSADDIQKRREAARQRHAEKMVEHNHYQAMPEESPQLQTEPDYVIDDHVFIAFARVYSGCVHKGQKLYVLGPKHDPGKALQKLSAGSIEDTAAKLMDLSSDDHMTVVTVTDLYMFMGRELESLDCVPAGNVLGIGGLEDHILKSGTLSSSVACPAFTDMYFDASPILRVAVEPAHAADMPKLVRGLKFLNQADPCVQVLVQETGEHVIITAGEVHLRRCIDDLKERYAKIDLTVSSPIVPFRETIVPPPTTDMVNESILEQNLLGNHEKLHEFENDVEILDIGLVRMYTSNKNCMVQIRAIPLPEEVTNLLEENQFLIKTLDQYVSSEMSERYKPEMKTELKLKQSTKDAIRDFKDKLQNLFSNAGKQWHDCVDNIWAFGPKRVGPNLLLNHIHGYSRTPIWECFTKRKEKHQLLLREYDYSVVSGFQLACLTGPLCDEPLRGVCFMVEEWDVHTGGPMKGLISQAHVTEKFIEKSSKSLLGSSDVQCNVEESLDSLTLDSNNTKNNCHNNKDISSECVTHTSNGVGTSDTNNLKSQETSSEHVTVFTSMGKDFESQSRSSGQLISLVKEACQKAFQTQPQRLMAAMYKCTIQATSDVLGKLYGVINKRHGRILSEDMVEGSQIFNIVAVIPVVESFGFSEDVRKKTSGLASPQLVFSHWEVIEIDPFWVPTTEEEIMHFGEKADSANRAYVYMNNVRERKGLKVDKKIVEHGEKQRTLTRNK